MQNLWINESMRDTEEESERIRKYVVYITKAKARRL